MSSQQGQIRMFVLEALDRTSGEPIPEGALTSSVQIGLRHLDITRTDARAALVSMEADHLISATRDEVMQQTLYGLTPKGQSAFRARST